MAHRLRVALQAVYLILGIDLHHSSVTLRLPPPFVVALQGRSEKMHPLAPALGWIVSPDECRYEQAERSGGAAEAEPKAGAAANVVSHVKSRHRLLLRRDAS